MKQCYGYLVIDCVPQYHSEIKVCVDVFPCVINLVTFPIISIPIPFLPFLHLTLAFYPFPSEEVEGEGKEDEGGG